MKDKEIEQKIQSNSLVRIADAIEEILQLVKVDQEANKKRMEKYENENN